MDEIEIWVDVCYWVFLVECVVLDLNVILEVVCLFVGVSNVVIICGGGLVLLGGEVVFENFVWLL